MITLGESIASEDVAIGELLVESFVAMYAKKMPEVVVSEQRKKDLRDVASRRLSKSASVWVARSDSREVVGTLTLFKPGDSHSRAWFPNVADLRYLAVSLQARGQGIPTLLLDATVAKAREWNVDGICLHVRRGAHGVAGVYTRYGFRRAPEGDQDQRPEMFLDAYLLAIP